jgi:hypothetical protein
MRHYVQLKDGVVFAAHQSTSEVDDSGPNVWAVDEDGSDKVGKLYDNGNFSDAPVIKYATIDESNGNTVVGIHSTVFSSEVTGPVITDSAVKVLWTWNGTEFVPPNIVEPVEIIMPVETVPMIETEPEA